MTVYFYFSRISKLPSSVSLKPIPGGPSWPLEILSIYNFACSIKIPLCNMFRCFRKISFDFFSRVCQRIEMKTGFSFLYHVDFFHTQISWYHVSFTANGEVINSIMTAIQANVFRCFIKACKRQVNNKAVFLSASNKIIKPTFICLYFLFFF